MAEKKKRRSAEETRKLKKQLNRQLQTNLRRMNRQAAAINQKYVTATEHFEKDRAEFNKKFGKKNVKKYYAVSKNLNVEKLQAAIDETNAILAEKRMKRSYWRAITRKTVKTIRKRAAGNIVEKVDTGKTYQRSTIFHKKGEKVVEIKRYQMDEEKLRKFYRLMNSSVIKNRIAQGELTSDDVLESVVRDRGDSGRMPIEEAMDVIDKSFTKGEINLMGEDAEAKLLIQSIEALQHGYNKTGLKRLFGNFNKFITVPHDNPFAGRTYQTGKISLDRIGVDIIEALEVLDKDPNDWSINDTAMLWKYINGEVQKGM